MGERIRTTVGGLGELFDGPHATPQRRSDGPFFLNISSLKSGRLDLTESDHVSEEDFSKWTRRITPEAGDLLFSYETRLGDAALMPDGVKACLGRRMALLRPDRTLVDPRFLLYFYLGPEFQRIIATHTIHGATVERIGLATMPSWEVDIPPLAEQRAIAEILGALDDKVTANDAIEQASESLMVLIASSSPRSVSVGELASQTRRSIKPNEFDERVAHFSLPAFDAGAWPEEVEGASIKSNKILLESPTVLISKLNPRIPRTWDVATLPKRMALASTEFVALQPTTVATSELWAALCQPAVAVDLAGKVAGTSGSHQRVKPAEVLSLEVLDPRALTVDTRDLIASLGRRRDAAKVESRSLASTRDALLPLLMSGKVRVKDAEKVVEEVL